MDSLGGKMGVLLSHNVFAYCNNNAVNMVDPNGNWAIAISFATEAIGGILATAATILSTPVVIVGATIIATAFLGYAVYTYYTSSSGSASYSSEAADSGSVEEVSSGTGGGGGSISPEPPKSNKKPKKTTHGHHSYPKYLGGAAAQKLIEIAPDLHKKVHSLIHQFEGGWLAPKRGYTGRIIQNIYTPKQIQDGLIRFYNSVDEFKDLIEPLKNAIEYTMGR